MLQWDELLRRREKKRKKEREEERTQISINVEKTRDRRALNYPY